MARMAGLEPATPALTARCTTIVLHPIGCGSRIRTDVMQLMRLPLGTTPVNPAFSQSDVHYLAQSVPTPDSGVLQFV